MGIMLCFQHKHSLKNAELDFRHVQPTSMLDCSSIRSGLSVNSCDRFW